MSKLSFLKNMTIAFFEYPFKRNKFKNRNIWLVGGHAGDIYNDNSKAFYEYLIANKSDEVEVYWVINEDSKAIDKIPGNKLIRGSVENYLYYYNANAIVFSHSPSADIAPYNFAVPVLNKFHKKVIKVYLNHGTISFKKRKPMNARFKKLIDELLASYNLVTASSDFEKNIMVNEWGMCENSVRIVGNARYDLLSIDDEADTSSNSILYTPTWRDWIKNSDKKFTDTDYCKSILDFLNNKKLEKILKERNLYIKFYMHHLMHEYIDDIEPNIHNERVIILDKSVILADEIRKSLANITDYSSVAIDFLYMNRPVLFYQFDIDEYKEKVDSYIDLDNELFGTVAYNVEGAVNGVVEMINNNFSASVKQIDDRKMFFKYNDNKNCDRIYSIITEKINKENRDE